MNPIVFTLAAWAFLVVGWIYHEHVAKALRLKGRVARQVWIWAVIRPADLVRMLLLPAGHIRHQGRHHPVSAAWAERHKRHRHLFHKSNWELYAMRARLIRKSQEIKSRLPEHERSLVAALDAHRSVRNRINSAEGRHPREFGYEGADQLVITKSIPPCGCVVRRIHNPNGPDHPHGAEHFCERHDHLRGQPHPVVNAQIDADNHPSE